MQALGNLLRVKFNIWRLNRYRLSRRGHRAAKNELREAQVWCATKTDVTRPKECFRDERLRPAMLTRSRLDAVDEVRRHRRLFCNRDVLQGPAVDDIIARGRLIAYSPDYNLFCGASEVETQGYFDVNNTPPWDSWVALLDSPNAKCWETSLIAWVPPEFVPLVQAGINVIPEECVLWLEDCPAALQRVWNKVVMTEREEPQLLKLTRHPTPDT